MIMHNYWLTEGEIIKHKKFGVGIVIKANNINTCWAVQNLKTNEIHVYDENDLPNMEVISKWLN